MILCADVSVHLYIDQSGSERQCWLCTYRKLNVFFEVLNVVGIHEPLHE